MGLTYIDFCGAGGSSTGSTTVVEAITGDELATGWAS